MQIKRIKKVFIFFLTLCLLLPGMDTAFAYNSPSEMNENNYSTSQPDNKIEEKLANSKNGKIKVIVELDEQFTPEGQISSKEKVDQNNRIKAAQEAVIENVHKKSPNVAKNITKYKTIPYMALEVDSEGLQALRESEEVKNVFEDKVITKSDLKTDNAENETVLSPQLIETNSVMNTEKAWSAGYTGQGNVVAILDTGVDSLHPFLQGKVVYEGCFSTLGLCSGKTELTGPDSAVDTEGHGTHVAGIATGKGSSFSGVAKDANIIAIKILANGGNGNFSDLINGLEQVYILRNQYNISAVNLSLGGGSYPSNCDTEYASVKSIVDNLKSVGIATIAASGNEYYKSSISAPACISSVISVGATNNYDNVASFSNSSSSLDLLAPGNPVYSSLPGGIYGSLSGTSMATPQVSGGFTLVKQKYPTATVDQILTYLSQNGIRVTDAANNIIKPRLDFSWMELNLPSLGQVQKPTWNGDLIQWVGVDNASLYELKLYKDSTLLNTQRVEASVRQYNFTSPTTTPGIYTVTVQAIGDHSSHQDGEVSVPSDENRKGILYYESFESNNGDFTVGGSNSSWQWGTPTSGPSSAYSGTKVWATNLSGYYNNYENSSITSPNINLRNVGSPITLSWMQYAITEQNYDYLNVEISKDGGQTWNRIYRNHGSINQSWGKQEINLDTSYAVPNFKVRFNFETDGSLTLNGVYIDDIMVTGSNSIPELNQVEKPTWIGNVIQWVGVENASQYEVKLFNGTNIVTTQQVDASVRQYDFSSQMTNTGTYTVTVQPLGDGSNYQDGPTSVASEVYTGIYYFENFENNNGSFTLGGTNSSWQWGTPISSPNTAFSGNKVWGTNLSGNYNNSENSFILSPVINLDNVGSPLTLSWMQYAVTEQNFDYLNVEVSKDGGQTWSRVYQNSGTIDQQWGKHEVNLDSTYAVPEFRVRFGIETDWSAIYTGISIDDVTVSSGLAIPSLDQVYKPIWNGNIIQWDEVANASQYEMKLYKGTELIHSQQVDSSVLQLDLASQITVFGVYRATVQALGDHSNYEDGPASIPSEGHGGIFYYEDFEGNNGNYIAGGSYSTWEWGTPSYGPSTAFSGTKVWATNLNGDYNDSERSYITSSEIDLSNIYSPITISWMQYAITELNLDYLNVEVSKDGGQTWNRIYRNHGTINQDWGHNEVTLDSSYAVPTFNVRFGLETDISVTYPGIYIDDVLITKENAIPALDQVQQLTWYGDVIHWDGVANASQYEIKLYTGNSLVTTQRVEATARELNLDSYMYSPGAYKVTVQALGEHTTYRDGQSSNLSEENIKMFTLYQVQKPVWSGNTVQWDSIPYATQYEVKLFNGTELVYSELVDQSVGQYDFANFMTNPGVYTVTVQALGDNTYYQDGPTSIPSDDNRKLYTLEQVQQPTWNGDVIQWTTVSNASQYEVKLYRGITLIATARVGSAVRQYNFASKMKLLGVYSVTVQAIGDNGTYRNGPTSILSNQRTTLKQVSRPTWSGDIIQWTSVSNATEYEVKLYRGTTLVSTQRVWATIRQYNFASKMMIPGLYTVSVQAIGDYINYKSGLVSERSIQRIK